MSPPKKTVSLALQGGGSHGAFTWGVLDAFLEDGRLDIEGVSGTSAGAINAVLMAHGLQNGGREQARHLLRRFWDGVADAAIFSPFQPSWFDRVMGNRGLALSPGFQWYDAVSRLLTPLQTNPFGFNPLRKLLLQIVDFAELRAAPGMALFLGATNVTKGRLRVFERHEITPDVVLASTCLPNLFQAVRIEGDFYWDGGFMGNPTLYPLIGRCKTPDIVIVQVNPIERPQPPVTAQDIADRINEISFNSSLQREIEAIEMLNALLRSGSLHPKRQGPRPINLHVVDAEESIARYTATSKYNASGDFLAELHELGAATGKAWLTNRFDSIGIESSCELDKLHVNIRG